MSVQVSAQHRRFGVPFNTQLANLIPGSIETEFDGDKYVVVPHTTDTTRIARNLGYKVPAPLTSRYDWAGDTPFRTQRITAAMLTMNKRAFVLSQMGTGKTRAALHALNFLLAERAITSALIAAPLSTLTLVWDREIFEFFPHLNVSVLYGTKAQRLDALKKPADIYIINHDGVEVIREALVARKDIGCVIIDEVAAYRNQQTARWKTMQQVVYDRGYVWGLTGSPTPNEPTDAYGQVKLFMPHKVPRHFSHFRKSTMRQITQFKWIAKEDANDTVFELMQPAVRFRRDECVELPPVSYVGRQAAMSKVQEKVYKALVAQLRVSFQNGEVTAANEGVLFSKLLQISAGWVYTSNREVIDLDPHPRLNALAELLDESDTKVIVFVDFIHAAKEVFAWVTQKGYSAGFVTGETPKALRDQIFKDFQFGVTPRVLVAHPKCMSHGLTLTAASTIVWYTPTTSLETYEQACARITRPGQKEKQLIAHLTGSKVEAKLYKRLQQKASLQGALLEMFEEKEMQA